MAPNCLHAGMVPNQQFVHEVEDAIPDRDTNLVLVRGSVSFVPHCALLCGLTRHDEQGCKSGKRSATAWHVLHNEVCRPSRHIVAQEEILNQQFLGRQHKSLATHDACGPCRILQASQT